MRGRLLLNLVLVLAVAGLGAWLWLDADEDKPVAPITALAPDKIKTIEIEYADAPALGLKRDGEKRDGEQWLITAPISARAETSEIKPILRVAGSTPVRSYPVGEMDLASVGLDKPTQILHFDGVKIELGATEPLDNNRYARVKDRVYLINNPIKTSLDSDYSDLVARALLRKESKITRLELPDFTLTPTDSGGWQVQPPAKDQGADAAQWTIDAWQDVQALWIKPSDPKLTSQDKITVTTADGTTYNYQVVAREPQLVLRDPALHVDYHVAANQVAPLLDMQHPDTPKPAELKTRPDIELTSPTNPPPTNPPKP